jgi:hypothetical protein
MLNVKLKILGDPDYIKQDDVFYRPPLEGTNVALTPSVDPRLLPNNSSLKMDAGGLYVQLLFRVPTDIDESTGFMKFEGSYKHSVFSGLYLIQKITNNFAHGQFIQELDMVRMPRQSAYDYVNNQSTNASDARSETSKQTQPGIQPPAPVPSMLVSNPNSVSNAADSNANQTAGQEQSIAQAQDNPAPIAPPDQQALMAVNDTAPEAVITDQTQPQAVVPDFTPISIRGNQVPGAVAITG